jgi:hypothetical protein
MNRLSQEKANAIAAEYVTNGFKAVDALLAVGYKQSYAVHCSAKLLDNVQVKQAIARIQADTKLNTGITIAKIQAEHQRLQALSESKGDLSTATANLVNLGKTIGAYALDNAGKGDGLTLNFSVEQPAREVMNEEQTTT